MTLAGMWKSGKVSQLVKSLVDRYLASLPDESVSLLEGSEVKIMHAIQTFGVGSLKSKQIIKEIVLNFSEVHLEHEFNDAAFCEAVEMVRLALDMEYEKIAVDLSIEVGLPVSQNKRQLVYSLGA